MQCCSPHKTLFLNFTPEPCLSCQPLRQCFLWSEENVLLRCVAPREGFSAEVNNCVRELWNNKKSSCCSVFLSCTAACLSVASNHIPDFCLRTTLSLMTLVTVGMSRAALYFRIVWNREHLLLFWCFWRLLNDIFDSFVYRCEHDKLSVNLCDTSATCYPSLTASS